MFLRINTNNDAADPSKLMEKYIESGFYKNMKKLTLERDVIQKNIYGHLIHHESKRHEIGYNLVAKFITRKVFQYDSVGLNEYLYDRGLLQHLTRLSGNLIKKQQNLMDLFSPYQIEPKFYIKPSFNKAGREMVKVEKPFTLNVNLEEAAKKKRENMTALRKAKLEYERVKIQLAKSEKLHREKKVKHKYGSLSWLQKPTIYDVNQITDPLALQAVIEFGKPDVEQLDYYIIRGFISKSEIDSFRELTDIKLEFVILDLDEEASILSSLYQKRINRLLG